MAYTEQQKSDHIRELQGNLHRLSHVRDLPHLSADGIYGSRTAEAVRAFQKQNGMRPTGEVDSGVWNAIVDAIRTDTAAAFPTGIRSYASGSDGAVIFLIQAMLLAVHARFDGMPQVAVSGVLDQETKDAVAHFQQHTSLPVSGAVDPATWHRLLAAAGVVLP